MCKKTTAVYKSNFFKGSKLWKLEDGKILRNKAFPHIGAYTPIPNMCPHHWSYDKWIFKINGDLIYIEKSSSLNSRNLRISKVFETKSNGKVRLKDLEEDKAEQLWKTGVPNAEGYFTLENSKVKKFMTAMTASNFFESSIAIEMKGKQL